MSCSQNDVFFMSNERERKVKRERGDKNKKIQIYLIYLIFFFLSDTGQKGIFFTSSVFFSNPIG